MSYISDCPREGEVSAGRPFKDWLSTAYIDSLLLDRGKTMKNHIVHQKNYQSTCTLSRQNVTCVCSPNSNPPSGRLATEQHWKQLVSFGIMTYSSASLKSVKVRSESPSLVDR